MAGGGIAHYARSVFDAAKHPRGPDGKFISKGRVSFRVSPRSATVMYGHTIPVVPGKVNVYVGALARVERSRGHETVFEKKLKARGKKITEKLPARVQKVASKGGFETPGGTTFVVQRPRVRQPQVKVSRKVGGTYRKPPIRNPSGAGNISAVRSPNRKPRAPRAQHQPTLERGTVKRPTKAVSTAKGKKVKK